MIQDQLDTVRKLSKEDKLELVHLLWDDIANEPDSLDIPNWHKKILDERLEKIQSGEATFRPWSEIKKKYEQQ